MDLLNIRIYPDDILREECAAVKTLTALEVEILDQMVFSMHHFGGIGLAAPQVGILKRLIVADIGDGPIKLVNPQVVKVKDRDIMREGCLSVPKVQADVERALEIAVRGLNEKGENIELKIKGLLARVIQHEIDHLDGKLIIDYLDLSEGIKFYMTKEAEEKDGNKNTF